MSMLADESASPKRRPRSILAALVKFGIVAGLFTYLFKSGHLDLTRFGTALERPGYLAAGIVCMTLIPVVVAIRWRWVLGVMGVRCTLGEAVGLTYIGQVFNNIVPLGPSGGDVAKGVYLARRHRETELPVVVSSILADRVLGMVGLDLLALGWISTALITWRDAPTTVRWLLWGGLAIFGVAVTIMALILWAPTSRWILSRPWMIDVGWRGQLRRGIDALNQLVRRPRAVAGFVCYSMFDHALSIGACWCFAQAIGLDRITPLINFALIPVCMVVIGIPGIPQGLGTFEAVVAWAYTEIGVKGGAEVALLWHGARLISTIIGIGPFLWMDLKKEAPPGATGPVS